MAGTNGLLAVLIATIVGSGVGTSLVGFLFKHRFDVQLAKQTAMLQRHSRIHELQVEALGVIHSDLNDALFYLQKIASAGRTGQVDDTVALQAYGGALGEGSGSILKEPITVFSRANDAPQRILPEGI